MSRICGCSGISAFPPASLAAPRRAGVAGLELWPGFICRSSREELAFILGFLLHPLLHLTEAFRAADHFIISLWSFLINHSWSGVWGWVLRWVFYFVLFCWVSVISCWVWGFLGQINLDFFFFFEHSQPFSLSSFPPHEMILSPPCLQDFPNSFIFMVSKTNCGALCHSWLCPGNWNRMRGKLKEWEDHGQIQMKSLLWLLWAESSTSELCNCTN